MHVMRAYPRIEWTQYAAGGGISIMRKTVSMRCCDFVGEWNVTMKFSVAQGLVAFIFLKSRYHVLVSGCSPKPSHMPLQSVAISLPSRIHEQSRCL